MISLKTLFERDGVNCPSWLSSELLEANWMDSISLDDGIHKWRKDTLRYWNGDEGVYLNE